MIDPVQPTRSAITVAGMSGVTANSRRTNGSHDVNDVATTTRSYLGGRSDAPTPRSVTADVRWSVADLREPRRKTHSVTSPISGGRSPCPTSL